MKHLTNKPNKFALFVHPTYEYYSYIYCEEEAKVSTYARVSEWVEIAFPSLPDPEIIQSKVSALDKEIEETMKNAMESVLVMRKKRDELLAITYEKPKSELDECLDTFESAPTPEDDIPF
jgi:hypothetical protein